MKKIGHNIPERFEKTDVSQFSAAGISAAAHKPLEALLDSARSRLLEVSSRTTLLAYKLSKSSGIGIDRESPAALCRILVVDGKRMYFESALSDDPSLVLDSKEDLTKVVQPPLPAEMIDDDRIQTLHSSADLQARLVKTAERVRLDQEERGIHSLYLALGLVSTILADGKEIRAPLILVPVTLERRGTQGRFSLVASGDGPTHNYALEAHLKKSFGIDLPNLASLNETGAEFNLLSYFDHVADAIKDIPNTSINRDACSLGIFSFEGVSLYKDLDPANWPKGKTLLDSPTLRRLVNGISPRTSDSYGDQVDYSSEPALVMPGDPSQLRCISRAANGEDLIIHGPPGTGKSHTITNMGLRRN